jgi:tryptophanyl-tRNA synthetase
MKRTIFSGIQPSGTLHIGNYVGAIKQWVEMQNSLTDADLMFCIVDLHAITVKQDPEQLRRKNREVAALFIAAGIDPKKSKIFIQSENPDHPYLGWILNCYTPFGQLERMTQFKDKSAKQQEGTTAGLFDYPVLMAADILLYDTDEVPVGEDQKQHIELTRDIAEKFNAQYGEVFKLPEPRIIKETARIMSLQNPLSKMSKSDDNPAGSINLLDSKDIVADKIKRAVTDSGSEVLYREDKPAISNLLAIYSRVTDISIPELEKKYQGVGYGTFKKELGEAVISFLEQFQARYHELIAEGGELDRILDDGSQFVRAKSAPKVKLVQDAVGLGRA